VASRTSQILELTDDAVLFLSGGRRFRLPIPSEVAARNPSTRGRFIASVDHVDGREDGRVWFTDGGRATLLSSLVADYDLSPFIEEGETLPNPPQARLFSEQESPTEVVVEAGPVTTQVASIVVATIAGLPLEVVEGEWVTLRSLYEPFGKRVDKQIDGLKGWALVRKFRLTPKGVDANSAGIPNDAWCVHRTHAAQAIADLSTMGMSKDVLAAFVKYKRECASALDDYFTTGKAENPRLVHTPTDPWTILKAVSDCTLELRTEIRAANEQSLTAITRADEAATIAQRAIVLAEQKSDLSVVAHSTPPGSASETPDGAWSARKKDGFMSMRAVASKYALPFVQKGAKFVSSVAKALNLSEVEGATDRQSVVIGGRVVREDHITYGPKAIELLDRPLRLAQRRMMDCGYVAINGVMQARGSAYPKSRDFALQEMMAAAAAGAAGVRAVEDEQKSPPIDVEKAG